ASCRRYSSSSPPVSAPPPRYRRESSPMAPVDRLLRADRLSQTVPPAACPHQRTPVAPSWPPRIIAVTSEIRTGQRQELFFEAPLSLSHSLERRSVSMVWFSFLPQTHCSLPAWPLEQPCKASAGARRSQ